MFCINPLLPERTKIYRIAKISFKKKKEGMLEKISYDRCV